MKEDLWLAILY